MRIRLLVLPLSLAIVLGVGAGAAWAMFTRNMYPNSFYNPPCVDGSVGDTFCRTDNAYVTVYRQSSLSSTGKANIGLTLDNSYAGTDLSVHYAGTAGVEYSGSAETDIIYQQSTTGLSSTTIGITWCNDAVAGFPSITCDQHYVRFRGSSPTRELACHETGHAVGLTHGEDAAQPVYSDDPRLGCMVTPYSGTEPYLESNNVENINFVY